MVIDFVGTVDGVEFEGGKSANYPFIIGQKQMLSDFEDGVADVIDLELDGDGEKGGVRRV